MNSVLSVLLTFLFNSYDHNINYDIAWEIVDSIDEINQLPVTTLAKRCNTSTNSVNKFCKLLGFSNYNELRNQLSTSIAYKKQIMKHDYEKTNEQVYLDMLSSICELDSNYIQQQVNELVELMIHTDQIHLIAANYTQAILLHNLEEMILMHKKVSIHQLLSNPELPQIDHNDLVLVISGTGMITSIYNTYLNELKNNSNHIYFILGKNDENKKYEPRLELPPSKGFYQKDLILYSLFDYIKYIYYLKEGSNYVS